MAKESVAAELARALDAEPLFHMSLGSKELFHSNFIAWFARKYADEACAVLGPWAGAASSGDQHRVGREEGDLDLVIELPGHNPLVVENKVFSMPDERQLERYAQGPVAKMKRRPALVLLSLANPGWKEDEYRGLHGTWRHVGYDSLRRALLGCVGRLRRSEPYDADTVQHYCELVRLLVELKDLVAIHDNGELIPLSAEAAVELARVRVADHAQKLRMHQIGARLRALLTAEVDDVEIRCDYTSGGPLIDAFVPFKGGNRVGWQYQGGQFRLAIVLESLAGRGPDAKKRREVCARGYDGWFDFSRFHAVLGTTDETTIPRRARDGFCHYDPTFVYRYRKPSSMTVGQLLDLGVVYVQAAREFAASQATN